MGEGGLFYLWKNLGNIPWDDSLLFTYKRRTPSPYSTTHQGEELHHKSIIPKGLGPSLLVDLVRERCEGEYGEEPDLSVSPRACTSMNTCASMELSAK
jgi:hypothetical protein